MKNKLEEEERQEGKRRFNTLVCTSTYVRIYWRTYALTHQHDARYSRLHEKKSTEASCHDIIEERGATGREGGNWRLDAALDSCIGSQ